MQKRTRQIRRATLVPRAATLCLLAAASASRADWSGYAGDPQHTAISTVAAQPLNTIKWSTPVDTNPVLTDGELLIHYGSPVITSNNTIIVPVKSNSSFSLNAINAATGQSLWTQTTDYTVPPSGGTWPDYQGWIPSYGPALNSATNTVYYAGAGGIVYARGITASSTPTRLAFFGNSAYSAATSLFNANVAISTPITTDSQGDLFFGYTTSGADLSSTGVTSVIGTPLTSGIARISASGVGSFFNASDLTFSGSSTNPMTQVVTNSAPAISNDGSTVYVAMSTGNYGNGRLVALSTSTLLPNASVQLTNPNGSPAQILNLGTASPTVGPDGDVYMGVYEFTSRGWMDHFSGDLATSKTPGGFGWDDTASIVPASMVPSYHGTSTYLIMTKYNNYADGFSGGDGHNMIAILDPNAAVPDTRNNIYTNPTNMIMQPVLTITGPTADEEFPDVSGAVREWCINTAVVDPLTDSILVNNEDGHLYRWNLATNTLTEVISLAGALGEAYTPTLIGPDGTTYAINGGNLYAVGALAGDVNSDGQINIDDYLALDRGYLKGLKGWANGDLNGDGTVNAADFAILDAAFAANHIDITLPTPIPEPASLSLLALATCAMLTSWNGRPARGRPRHVCHAQPRK